MKKLLVSLLASSVMLVACGQKTQTEAEEQEKQEQVADAQQTDNVAIESVNDQSSQENKATDKSDDDRIVHVDFSKELATEMQAGASGELEILYRIVDTIANLYQAEAVNLTLDGDAYNKGGHVHIDKDQLLYPTHGPMAQ